MSMSGPELLHPRRLRRHFFYLATPATEKTLPPDNLPPADSGQQQTYLNRISDLNQQTMLPGTQGY